MSAQWRTPCVAFVAVALIFVGAGVVDAGEHAVVRSSVGDAKPTSGQRVYVAELSIQSVNNDDDHGRVGLAPQPSVELSASLVDIYLDEERPVIGGDASKAILETIDLLAVAPSATLSMETYCDQRNSAAYAMVLSRQRTREVREFVEFLEAPAQRVTTAFYGSETPMCDERQSDCWEDRVRVKSAFRYLAITQPRLGCLVRVSIHGIPEGERMTLHTSPHEPTPFLQKIRLAPVKRRRHRRPSYIASASSSARLVHPKYPTGVARNVLRTK